MFAAERALSRSPFTEKLLRPPGESLRLKIDEIRNEMSDVALKLAIALIAPSFVMAAAGDVSGMNAIRWLVAALIGYGVAFRQWQRFKKLRNDLRNYHLGFDGERHVAAELSGLLAQGFRVFHDFVFDMKPGGDATTFNIDHIVVGTAGVFVIETKTRRKPNGVLRQESKSHEIAYTGSALRFPGGYETAAAIDQARRNAEDLSKWLTGSAPRAVPTVPVVVIPGWYVKRERAGFVKVLSGKEVAKHLPSLGVQGALTESEAQAIADRIDAHCRNIDA
jgi:hypothetical protein